MRASPGARGEEARKQVGEATMLLQLSPESTIRAYATYNNIIRSLAQQKGLPFADVRSVVPSDPQYWGDATHFKEAGSTLAAQAIANVIIQNALPARDTRKQKMR